MYRTETVDVLGSSMPVLVFEPEGEGPHPGLVIAQHLPVAHAGLEKDPFQLRTGERYAAAAFVPGGGFSRRHRGHRTFRSQDTPRSHESPGEDVQLYQPHPR